MSVGVESNLFNPLDPEFIRDPYPVYEFLRDHDPVHRTEFGFWVLTRHEHIVSALNDPRLSNAPAPFALVNRCNRERFLAAEVANGIIPFLDPPEHTPPRRLIAAALQAHLKGRESVIEGIANRLLSALRGKRRIEFLGDFATPFATTCICRIMGFPEADAPRLKRWSNMFFYLFHAIPNAEILQQVNDSLREFRDYTRQIVQARRRAPQDDLITRLCQAGRDGYTLGAQELIDNCMLIAADGIENVESGLATAVATLLQHPDQLERLLADPDLVWSAVLECLRYHAPGQYQGRIALEEIEVGGKTIPANSVVLLVLASANRDPRAVDDPDSFRIDRNGFRHLSFGIGKHSCIGGALVGIEFQAAFKAIFDGTRRIELAAGELNWIARAGHRWLDAVNLEITELGQAAQPA